MDLNKIREERAAREKARIQKLRELNLQKYAKKELHATSSQNFTHKAKPASANQAKNSVTKNVFHTGFTKNVKNNFHVTKRPITAPSIKSNVSTKVSISSDVTAGKTAHHNLKSEAKPVASTSNIARADNKQTTKSAISKIERKYVPVKSADAKLLANSNFNRDKAGPSDQPSTSNNTVNGPIAKSGPTSQSADPTKGRKSSIPTKPVDKVLTDITKKQTINLKMFSKNVPASRQSLAHKTFDKPKTLARKSMLPTLPENSKSESVFDRLYKPKYIAKKVENEVDRLKTDPNYLKKIISNSGLITSKRHTCFDVSKEVVKVAPRRSISAVHLKRISKSEAANCIHKWASIGDNINKLDLEDNEDDKVKGDRVVSAIKSERKKVKFFTPVPSNLNTPSLDELQTRLTSWLQKRGKSLESYHHLQCFGVHHLKSRLDTPKHISFVDREGTPVAKNEFEIAVTNFDEENKENIALDSDSDDGSFVDTMAEPLEPTLCPSDKIDIDNWRRASIDTESVGFNESTNFNETTITSADTLANTDDLLIGALNDLTALLREGFDWQQAARWLRSIRGRFPWAPRSAAYWECRAALEDSRGDLPASVQCWEEAIDRGTEHSVVESNLDQLLDKFMQLKISPRSGAGRQLDPKLVDVKNVFKSTIIRFAVQQAKLRRQSEHYTTPLCTVTPVRRSGRLSHCAVKTPVQICTSVRHAASIAPHHVFTPNKNIVNTP